MNTNTLDSTIGAILAPGKGILAADESLPTIGKRFKELGILSSEETRRAYRELLFTAPGLGKTISGVILFDETIRQKTGAGTPMAEILAAQGIVPGIKVDEGTAALPAFANEKFTLGLDRLRGRLAEYVTLGARFTKWRAVITIGEGIPTGACIEANAAALSLFAALSQEAGLVPIVEPEILMDGGHTIAACEEVAGAVLGSVFRALLEHRVVLEGMLLKTGMVLSGKDCPHQAAIPQVAEATLRCFARHVPAAVPGIVFLSGGQSDVAATQRMNAICRAADGPWKLTFSFGRALQDAAMKTWKGSPGGIAAAQAALLHRSACNGLAVQGKYSEQVERAG
ncbi:MAG TPA: class I fructose-bisphosphate aldolase [Opitutaceae bacterium]|nr:class I fructose-bisphosphate aldolase [Opitutaceae bacterium]